MIPFFNGPPPSKLGFVAKQEMPPHINILFRARPPLEYVPPIEFQQRTKYDFVHDGNHDLDKVFEEGPPPERECKETPQQRKERLWKQKVIEHYKHVKEQRRKYDPEKNSKATTDPFKTCYVGRLSFKTDEDSLMREMEKFGPVASLRLVRDQKTGRSRGYAFVEFKHQRHCDRLYDASGVRIDGKKILVDYEQARVDKEWLPKRLGGGRGNKRRDRSTERKIRKVIKDYKKEKEKLKELERKRSESRKSDRDDLKNGKDVIMEEEKALLTEIQSTQKASDPFSKDPELERKQSSGKHKRAEDDPPPDVAQKRQKLDEKNELARGTSASASEPARSIEAPPLNHPQVEKIPSRPQEIQQPPLNANLSTLAQPPATPPSQYIPPEPSVKPPPEPSIPLNPSNSAQNESNPAKTDSKPHFAPTDISKSAEIQEHKEESPENEAKKESKERSRRRDKDESRDKHRHNDKRKEKRSKEHKRDSRHRSSSGHRHSSKHSKKDRKDKKDKKQKRDKKEKKDKKERKDKKYRSGSVESGQFSSDGKHHSRKR